MLPWYSPAIVIGVILVAGYFLGPGFPDRKTPQPRRVPTDDELARHFRAGAFWVHEDPVEPFPWSIEFPAVYTTIHVLGAHDCYRVTEGSDTKFPIGEDLLRLVQHALLLSEAPSVR